MLFERFTFNNVCDVIKELHSAIKESVDDTERKILFYIISYMSLMPLRTQILTYQTLLSKVEQFMPVANYDVFLHVDNRLIPNIELMGIL